MPIQRRLPKFGFRSVTARFCDEIRLHELNGVAADTIDLLVLRTAGLITNGITSVKLIAAGKIERAIVVQGLRVTKGARALIEAAGGRVES